MLIRTYERTNLRFLRTKIGKELRNLNYCDTKFGDFKFIPMASKPDGRRRPPRTSGADHRKPFAAKVALVDLRRQQGRCRQDDLQLLDRGQALQGAGKRPNPLHRLRPQHLRCCDQKFIKVPTKVRGLRQPVGHGDRPQHRRQRFAGGIL